MITPTDLPEKFEDIDSASTRDFLLSERLIDPIIVLDRQEQKIVARLGAVRVINSMKTVYLPLTNQHTWIVDGKTIRPIPHDSPHLFNDLLQGFDPDDLPFKEAVRLLRDTNASISIEPSDLFLKSGKIEADELSDNIEVPGLTATLFPYQARGVQWMHRTLGHTGGLILADEMGLGKTIQIIALLLLNPPKKDSPALVVCPTSLIENWVREFSNFAKTIEVLVHRGPNRCGTYRGLQIANVIITTYDTLVNDISIFTSLEWSWVICDEAQAIKNPDSNRRQAIQSIRRKNSIPMTGTPVENSLVDLWSLADFAVPGLLGSRSEFDNTYPDTIESAKSLSAITDQIILKRTVRDVASDLPERINIDIPLELDEILIDHYLQVRQQTLEKYPIAGALVATLQLQLVCAHPWLRLPHDSKDEEENAEITFKGASPLITPKMERAILLLREAFFNGKKVLIFALFNRIGDLLKQAFTDFPEAYWGAINGSTPQSARQPIIDEFSNHTGPGCLVLNPKAAGAGLNITAATIVIHFTPVWNPALEAQASARAHRRGQKNPVTVYRLFYRDTVEEIMIARSLWKSDLANESIHPLKQNATDLQRALEISPRK
jgi:SNF2 family DNA or RNA helicase